MRSCDFVPTWSYRIGDLLCSVQKLTFGWTCADREAVVTRHSGDPLGLRAWANRVARDLTPGVTDITNRVQGYAVFCAGSPHRRRCRPHKVIAANEAFLRFEALWVHAQTRHRLAGAAIDRCPGSRAAQRMQTQSPVARSARLLTQQLSSGVFGAYRRSAIRFGLAYLRGGAIRPELLFVENLDLEDPYSAQAGAPFPMINTDPRQSSMNAASSYERRHSRRLLTI